MDTNKEKRLEIYRQSSEEIKDLYGSVETGRILINIENTIGLNSEEEKALFSIAIGDVILGIYKKESLSQLLRDRLKLTDIQIATIIDSLNELFKHIPENNANDILIQSKTESDQTSIKPLRTFPKDVDHNRAHSYGSFRSGENKPEENEPIHRSNQDDIIKP